MSVGVGVIGFGFMGRTHAAAYQRAGARLIAIHAPELDPEHFSSRLDDQQGNLDAASDIDLEETALLSSLDEFLALPEISAVSVCTPTDTHAEIAAAAMRAGKHVLIEKPVSLTLPPIETLADLAASTQRLCMPAMCMRFWPAWSWLKDRIDDGAYGALHSLELSRHGAAPSWNDDFYLDPSRSGSALFDVHCHDTDFMLHAAGLPTEIVSTGSPKHVATLFRYADDQPGPFTAAGGWLPGASVPFTMRYRATFQQATAFFVLGSAPELILHSAASAPVVPDVSTESAWQLQINAFLHAVTENAPAPPVTLEQAARVTRVLLAERTSLTEQRPVKLGWATGR